MVVKKRQTKDTVRNNFILFLCYIRLFNFHLVCIWRFGQCTLFFLNLLTNNKLIQKAHAKDLRLMGDDSKIMRLQVVVQL